MKTAFLFSTFVVVFGFIAGAIFATTVLIVPDVVTSATPLAVPTRFARVAFITMRAVLTTIAVFAFLAVCTNCTVCALVASLAVCTIYAV